MRGPLYCYYGEVDGKKKIAIPRVYGRDVRSGEYDIFTLELEKNEDDIRGKYVLYHEVDAVYNRRNFNTKKYKFNSLNCKDMYSQERSHKVMIIELENKSTIYVGGKIVSEQPIMVQDNKFTEIFRNYTFNDSPAYIKKAVVRYMEQLAKDMTITDVDSKSDDNVGKTLWKEDALTIEDLGLEDVDTTFIANEVYSEGVSPKFLGYDLNLGLSTYEDWAAEQYMLEALKRKGQDLIIGVVIYKDFVRIFMEEKSVKIEKEGDWKNTISMVMREFINKFKVKYTMILQQIGETETKEGPSYNFTHVVRKNTIYKG